MNFQEALDASEKLTEQGEFAQACDLLLNCAEKTKESKLWLKAVEIYEKLNEFTQARAVLIKAISESSDSDLISQASKKIKMYQQYIRGKEEHEEFGRLNKISKFVEGSLWHVVSKSWIKSWMDYILWDNSHPGPISNQDILETQNYVKDTRANKDYNNVYLKQEATEKIDFELISKTSYNFLENKYGHDNTVIKRWCISLNEDGSGLHVELRLKPIKFISIPPIQDQISTILMSRIETITTLKEKLLSLSPRLKVLDFRAWKVSEIKEINEIFKQKKYTINGKLLQESTIIEDCEIAEDDIIIAEFKHLPEWVLYRTGEICCYCKNSGILQNCSGCKVVKYCSKPCQIADFSGHKGFCKKVKSNQNKNQGKVGIQNLGNTCFMNSALQCVLHTPYLKNYFISQEYKLHLNKNNPLGTKDAALAKVFGEMVENVWLGTDNTISPWSFKKVISVFAPQFIGYEQHDAHELLTYLLTGLHEDLNQILIKPYVEKPDCINIPDESASNVSWNWFLERNKSYFVDIMYGQIKSTLKCPKCAHTSITFDPFLTFSVNIPNINKKNFTMLIFLLDNRLIKQELNILGSTKILKLKKMLIEKYKLNNLVICQYNKLNIQAMCEDYTEVNEYHEKGLVAFECNGSVGGRIPVPLKFYTLNDSYKQQITLTRLIFVQPEDTFERIHRYIEQLVIKDYKVNIINTAGSASMFSKHKLPCDFCGSSTCQNCPLPISRTSIKEASDSMNNSEGPFMLEVLLDLTSPFLNTCNDIIEEDLISEDTFTYETFTLKNCLEYSMAPETLDLDNEWYCSSCKAPVGALKTLQLYRLPKILIFHFIRFKNRGIRSQKINDFIQYPTKGLNLAGLVPGKAPGIYDLFAVCNHFGGIRGGHYTAFVEVEGKWYHMDDANVNEITEDQVITSNAYIVFYKLRE